MAVPGVLRSIGFVAASVDSAGSLHAIRAALVRSGAPFAGRLRLGCASMVRPLSHILLALALIAPAAAARAGSAEDDARAVFQEGLDAEKSGDPSTACSKFRVSLSLIHELGPIKKVKECDVRDGKLVAARDKVKELIAKWPQEDELLAGFREELTALEARLAHLDVAIAKSVPAGAKVRIDGQPVEAPASGVELDPGEHELLLEVPGEPLARTNVALAEGERRTVTLELPARPPPVGPGPKPHAALRALGVAGIVLAALGVSGIAVGVVTSPLVLSKKDEHDACLRNTPGACGDLATEGNTLLLVNGAGYVAGIALATLGGTLLVVDLATRSSGEAETAALRLGPLGATLSIPFR